MEIETRSSRPSHCESFNELCLKNILFGQRTCHRRRHDDSDDAEVLRSDVGVVLLKTLCSGYEINGRRIGADAFGGGAADESSESRRDGQSWT